MSVYIIERTAKDGSKRWMVRYRKGRYHPIVYCGSFKRRAVAETRKRWVEVELAAGRFPDVKRIGARSSSPQLRDAAAAWLATRIDLAESSREAYTNWLAHLEPLARVRVDELTVGELQAGVAGVDGRYAPASIKNTIGVLRQVLDHAGVRDNPASSRLLRLPRGARKPPTPPSRIQIAALQEALPERYRDLFRMLEHTGARISEAVNLTWQDVDDDRGRVLLDSKTPAGRRWVDYTASWCGWSPEDVLAHATEANSPDVAGNVRRPAPGARLYPFTRDAPARTLRNRCEQLGFPVFSPHDWRHLHCSRLLHYGWLSPAEIAARLGHASASFTLARYVHLVPPD